VPTGPRYVVLVTAYATRSLAPGRVDIGLPSLPDTTQWLQDLTLRSTVVTVQLSTACSSIGRGPPRSALTRHGIYCLKSWKYFERQG
jgi:hypothetical protein